MSERKIATVLASHSGSNCSSKVNFVTLYNLNLSRRNSYIKNNYNYSYRIRGSYKQKTIRNISQGNQFLGSDAEGMSLNNLLFFGCNLFWIGRGIWNHHVLHNLNFCA